MDSQTITVLLQHAEEGNTEAAERLYSIVYDDLRRRAGNLMGPGAAEMTLQPTAVVHEAWLRLMPDVDTDRSSPRWRERGHFLAVASKAMRSVLVDHARTRGSRKRGGDMCRLAMDSAFAIFDERGMDVLLLNEALEALADMDAQLARMVELRFFGGLSIEETSDVLGVSTATVNRGWRTARAWLRAELANVESEDEESANDEA